MELTEEDRAAILKIAKLNTGRCVRNEHGGWTWNQGVGYKDRAYRVTTVYGSDRSVLSYEITDVTDPNYVIPEPSR